MHANNDFRTWAMALHLSQLAGYIVVPLAGLIAPILIWQLKRKEMPELEEHGRIVANWLITSLIYWAVAVVLSFFVVGLVILPVLYVVGLIFPIIGAIQANNGIAWNYPTSIRFI
jgi:uncharacterized protein